MLCNACQDAFVEPPPTEVVPANPLRPGSIQPNVFLSPFYKASHHTVPRLKQSALDGCHLCHLLWTAAPQQVHWLLDEYLRNDHRALWLPCYLTIDRAIFREQGTVRRLMFEYKYQTVAPDNDKYVQPFKKHFRLLPSHVKDTREASSQISVNTWSEQSWNTLATWISRCFAVHSQCTPISVSHRRKLPRRLIEISHASTVRLHVLDRADNHEIEYLALSHCWGSGPLFRLTSKTEAMLQEGVEVSMLCKTFQDAILVTKRFWDEFGVRYLWIDSLCILQDSDADWRHESARMGEIYQNAFCTLAATAAEDGQCGLFFQRDLQRISPCLVPVRPANSEARQLQCLDEDVWAGNVSQAPLNARSWVLQERLLSPRVVHFAADQLYWECCGLEACESFAGGLPDGFGERFKQLLPFSGSPDFDQDKHHGRGPYIVWDQVMRNYSAGMLTRQSDRLVALSGVARKLQRFLSPQDTYLAGLWRSDLHFQLLWDSDENHRVRIQRDEYVAPTWSWASRTRTVPCEEETWATAVPMVSVVSAVIVPVDKDQMGQVQNGHMRLSGVLCRGGLARVHQPGSSTPGVVLKIENRTINAAICRIDDGVDTETHLPHAVYCLPVLRGLRNRIPRFRGLLLTPSGRENEFRRYGTFTADSTSDEFLVSCRPFPFETGNLSADGHYEITVV